MTFVLKEVKGYKVSLFKVDGADFGGMSERFRLYLIGVRASCLRMPFSSWYQKLLEMRTPRNQASILPCLLARDSPEVVEEFANLRAAALSEDFFI